MDRKIQSATSFDTKTKTKKKGPKTHKMI